MTDTLARLRHGKMTFETMVDLDAAMRLRKGNEVSMIDVVRDTAIYSDQKKGMRAAKDELENAFGTIDIHEITKRIVMKGEIEVTQEYRDEALEQKRKQVVAFLARNAVDARTGRPFTPDILESSLKEAGVRIDNKGIEQQMPGILEQLKPIIPIKLETKRLKITIPAAYTGKAYGLVTEYKEKEEWLGNGDLVVIIAIPVGMQSEFYDKLNGVTHGAALTEEITE